MSPMDGDVSYRMLADQLADTLRACRPGERLPSENELQDIHGVSRMTSRAALQELERRHLVRRTRGSGTFAALRIPYPIRPGMAPSWSAHVRSAGHQPSHTTLSATTERATAAVAKPLALPRRRTVTALTRLGLVDGTPASWHLSRVPLDLAPSLATSDALTGSLTTTLVERYGLRVTRSWSRAELLPLPARVATHLELAKGDMAWCIESVNRCVRRDRPVEHTVAWMRADTFRVFLELGAADHPSP